MEATVDLVRALVAEQFPRWSHLAVEPVPQGGWCNRTFRLGPDMLVRLPSADRYASQIPKECELLPQLACHLPLAISPVRGLGQPSLGYPFPWSVLDWIEGERLPLDGSIELNAMATDFGAFLKALQVAPVEGPAPGPHNFWRGGPLATYDREALEAPFAGADVWLHGDISPANLLVRDNRLAAVIDFGNCAVGDPACDYSIAWTSLPASARRRLRETVGGDTGTWLRARGWALWKALISLAGEPGNQGEAQHRATLQAILDDPVF